MSQNLLSFLTTSEPLTLTEEEFITYSNYCDECPFLSQISKAENTNDKYHICQFGQSLDSLFKQKKDFLFLESLNMVYVLGHIFKFMNNKNTKEIPTPRLSLKKIYYFGGMIKTSMYLKRNKCNVEGGEKQIKNESLLDLEARQVFFLSSLLYNLLTSKKTKFTENGLLEHDECDKKLKKNYGDLLNLIEKGIAKELGEKGLVKFIEIIKNQANKYEEISLKYQNEDHSKLEDFSLEIHQFIQKMNNLKPSLFIRDSLFLGYICVSVRRFIVYYVLYNDISIHDSSLFKSLSRIAIQTEKFEIFFQFYFDAADETKNCEELLDILRKGSKRKTIIQEIKKKYRLSESENLNLFAFFNKFQDAEKYLN